MSPERTNAYRQVIKTLNELGPSKLLDSEQDRIRYAADNLLFSSDLAEDFAALAALDDVERLCRALTESGRWEQVTVDRLAGDLSACGPPRVAELQAA
jgi:hypothetical protein